MYCSNCGKELDDKATICVGCGNSVKNQLKKEDTGSVGWWWLGFFFPLIGFILCAVWTGNQPKNAKKALWGALIGVIVPVILLILYVVLIICLSYFYIAYI